MKVIQDYLDELEDAAWNHSDSYKINSIRNKIDEVLHSHTDVNYRRKINDCIICDN